MPFGGGHDHRDADQHRFAENMELLDHDGLKRFGFDPDLLVVGAHAIDIHEELMAVAVFGSHTSEGGQQGFHLFDISDPENLQHLSFWEAGTAVGGDRTVAFAPDGQTVFLGFERGTRPGVSAVDVSNPSNPHEVAFWSEACAENPVPRPSDAPAWTPRAGCYGPHTVTAGEIDGVTHVFVINVGITILRYDANGFAEIARYHSPEQLAILSAPSQYDPDNDDPSNPTGTTSFRYAYHTVYAHDVWFYHDPVTAKDLLLVAYAFDGVKVLDVSNPQFPILQASWVPDSDLGINHYVHAFTAERLETGEFILVAGTEAAYEEHTKVPSPLWVLDGTAMVAAQPMQVEMELLSEWTNPDATPAGGLTNSMHWHRQQDGLLYVSHYHGGIWVIDLRTATDRAVPEHIGYIMPLPASAMDSPEWCCLGTEAGAPMVFDVDVDSDGNIYGADIIQGVTSMRLTLTE